MQNQSAPATQQIPEGGAAPASVANPDLHTLALPRIGVYWPEHGGEFLGIVAGDENQPDYLLIGGPIAPKAMNHTDALAWAQGLQQHLFSDWDIPNRRDGLVADANNKGKIPRGWYWLKDQYAHYVAYAWAQSFGDGFQDDRLKSNELEVVLVRRVPIQ